MARADNRYSRFVQLAKVAFPLLALGFLSTIFLFSRTLDPDAAIPFADIDVAQIAKDQRLAAPRFSGLTSDGSAITVAAESAQPDLTDPRRLSAVSVTANIRTETGAEFDVTSDTARFDGRTNMLDLSGDVLIQSSTGYALSTDRLVANMETTGLEADGEINGTAPAGTLRAGSMKLIRNGDTHLLVFKKGVKLVYRPKE